MPELPDTGTFAAASSDITRDDLAEEVSLGPSPEGDPRVYRGRFRPPDPIRKSDPSRTRSSSASCGILFCNRDAKDPIER